MLKMEQTTRPSRKFLVVVNSILVGRPPQVKGSVMPLCQRLEQSAIQMSLDPVRLVLERLEPA